MNIRKGTMKDYESILKLLTQMEEVEVQLDSNLRIGYFNTDEGKNSTKKALRKRNVIFLVAEDDNNCVIGFIFGKLLREVWWNYRPVAFINDFIVDSNYRRQGIGTKLVTEFENIAKQQGAFYIRLLAFPTNMPAVNFYKKHGLMEYSVYYQKKI